MTFDNSKGSVMLEFKKAASGKPAPTPPSGTKEDIITQLREAYKNVPTVEEVRKQFGLAAHEIQQDTITPLPRPEGTTYIAVISMDAAERLERTKPEGFVQNWENSRIRPSR